MKYQTIEEIKVTLPLFLRPKDVSEVLGVSLNFARQLFRSENTFETVVFGKRRYVSSECFLAWLESLEQGE